MQLRISLKEKTHIQDICFSGLLSIIHNLSKIIGHIFKRVNKETKDHLKFQIYGYYGDRTEM